MKTSRGGNQKDHTKPAIGCSSNSNSKCLATQTVGDDFKLYREFYMKCFIVGFNI